MRYGIFADVHSNIEALDAVIEAYRKESIDKYLCAGDLVGYAANPRECIGKIKALAELSVAGNHDRASIDLFSTDHFNPMAREAILWTRPNLQGQEKKYLASLDLTFKNKDLTLVHGSLDHPEEFDYITDNYTALKTFELLETDICFIGHSHVAGIFIKDKNEDLTYCEEDRLDLDKNNKYIVNVGSVGQPRDANPKAAYCIYDTDKRKVCIKRIDYDIEKTREKIIASGLPQYLGDRLLVGR